VRVSRLAPQIVAGDAAIAELTIAGLPHDDRAGFDQRGGARTVLGGGEAGERT
jgi:hypothetical protein